MRSIASQHAAECDALNPLDKLLHIDQRIWLPDDLLTKVDRASMACSLEVRVPYLDRRVVEFAARLPPQDKLHGSTTKWILKQLARKYLPDSIIDRKKSGFTIPLREWLNGGLRSVTDDCLGSLGTRGILRPQAINRLLAEHRSGRRNNGFRLWTLLVLELWFRRHHGDFRFSNDSLPGTKRL
jgi:asparagine synthase (glutamine-hydrolysing)